MRVQLVHYMAERDEREYIALIDPKFEKPEEFLEHGFSIFGVYNIEEANTDASISSLPTSRTFVEG
jgi:hypothetical protein